MGAAAIVAYGTHPLIAQHAHGLQIIMLARRLEWPLVTICLLFCIALLVLVIAGKRKAWWLIGLAPILALFAHHFMPPAASRLYVVEFTPAGEQPAPAEDAWVVGVIFEGQSYALPYAALYTTPVVFLTDYDKRMMVIWSAYANRAIAYRVARELKPRDLEIVSTPANTLLLYDTRLGQFIYGLTARTNTDQKPVGLLQPVATYKMTWPAWRKLHPDTQILREYGQGVHPAWPILPKEPATLVDGLPAETRVALVEAPTRTAIASDKLNKPLLNTLAGKNRVLILRDPQTHQLRAFDRQVQEDMFPTFKPGSNKQVPEAFMSETDSGSWWSADGKAVAGPLKGSELKELIVEPDLYWGVMKYWYPDLEITK